METKVSIIIPVFNGEKYIVECLDSIIKDKLKDIEIIVVNDGSYDNTEKIVTEYIKVDNRIKIINQKNLGSASARNTGVKNSSGKYLLFIDSDDLICKDSIYHMFNECEKYNLDVLVGDIGILKDYSVIKTLIDVEWDSKDYISNKQYLIQFFSGKGTPSLCNKMWKAELFKKYSMKKSEFLTYGEDGVLLPKLIYNSNHIKKMNKIVYLYRINLESKMHSKNIKYSEYIEAYNIVEDYFKSIKCDWVRCYLFTYKYYYVYSLINNITFLHKVFWTSSEVKTVRGIFIKDLKNENNIFLRNDDKESLNIINAYKKSIIIGEIFKVYLIIKRKIKSRWCNYEK
ncbi:glycosyltransferase family 2 protein [Clostridium perfringens]|uniref:glycosyltransferase family 2 protein n=1 Tax=Clostridium perfringens TaxID=1502 RepID=UPI002A2E8D92|nr:glycosyltransferase family 2 protein [Clostridium perfringens]MDK0948216.1 glycosyltransferase family 2 protein [Clostridium perfringens]